MRFMNLDITWRHHRYAGARRVRQGRDLAHYLAECSEQERNIAKRLLDAPPIGGASQQVIFVTTSPAALTTAQVTYIGPLVGIPQAPLTLCLHYCPQMATGTAAKTITIQMRRTDTPAVIGNAVHLNATTDTNPGPFIIVAYVPLPSTTTTAVVIPAGSGIDVQGADTGATAVPTASATAPITLGAFGLS